MFNVHTGRDIDALSISMDYCCTSSRLSTIALLDVGVVFSFVVYFIFFLFFFFFIPFETSLRRVVAVVYLFCCFFLSSIAFFWHFVSTYCSLLSFISVTCVNTSARMMKKGLCVLFSACRLFHFELKSYLMNCWLEISSANNWKCTSNPFEMSNCTWKYDDCLKCVPFIRWA